MSNTSPRCRRQSVAASVSSKWTRPPCRARGDALDPILWRGRQWAVTEYGIECLDGTYRIEADRLAKGITKGERLHGWCQHMAEKNWVDQDDFATAWLVSLALHGVRGVDHKRIREDISRMMLPDDDNVSR